ncbi:Bug family tripartite tricarboxylate transporter substrate binding protein [Halegenticoccus soli]|uniref:Bug family tripartite tricarboxylate transporter substrate binding protein n=1 Tax=Halegenticoccus soli TaxID=1985678 RepID=UPI0018EBEA3B|nr:tripartite tricarboxylate transporter substrate-binding protein [Halegenticoccus soli]
MTIDSTRRSVLKSGAIAGMLALAGCTGGGSNGGGGGSGDNGWAPERNVTVVVPWGAGGGTDLAVRQVMDPAATILKNRDINVQINVENITGAGGLNGASNVLNQPADGHIIFADTNVIAPNIAQEKATFTIDDWVGICRMQYDTSFIFTTGRNGGGYEDINKFVETAKQKTVQFGITGGLDSAVFPVEFGQETGILDNMEIVSYDDAGQMESDVITGEIDVAYGELVEIKELESEGEVKLLFAGIDEPVEGFEEVPTAEETGWDAQFGVQRALVAKNGTPDEAVSFWMDVVQEAMATDSYKEFESENYLDIRDGFLPGDEHMKNIENQIDLFKTAMEQFRG